MAAIFREYHRTHPWIDFQFDLNRLSFEAWHLLGQIQAHSEHVSGVPLLPSVADELHQLYLAKGILATTAIEGNSLTEEEALKAVKGELDLPPSQEYLQRELENICNAANQIANDLLSGGSTELTPELIKGYNKMILEGLPRKDEVQPGKFRQYDVTVVGVGYRGVPHSDVPLLVDHLCEWLNRKFVFPDHPIAMGILKAIVAHVYIAWIHPFGDGNGRTARLIELQTLLGIGLPMPSAHLLSNHYNQTRSEYYRYLDIASKREYGLYDFTLYALQGFLDNLTEQINLIERQQLDVHWVNYIHGVFRNKDGRTHDRRRKLMLDISDNNEPVPMAKIRHVSPRIAEAYADLTDRTVQRDVNALIERKLLVKTPGGFLANRDIMKAFMPGKRD